ncbi:MAG: hypothetical protein U0871_07180 [Gemmataceae bacterium]
MATPKQQKKAARAVVRELLDKYVLMRRVAADPAQLLDPADVKARKRLGIPIRPEVSLSDRAVRALRSVGITIRPTSYLHAPPQDHPTEWDPIYCYGPTPDKPVTRHEWECVPEYKPHPSYDCFIDADAANIGRVEAGLQALWNRAMGLCPSPRRFVQPVATDGPELDEWLRSQRTRLTRASLPKPAKKAPPRKFPVPLFVIAVNTDRGVVQVRWDGLSRPVDLARNPAVQRVFEAVVKAEEKHFGRLPQLPPVSQLGQVREKFAVQYQIVVGYAELNAFCNTTAGDTDSLDFDEAVTQLSPSTALDRTAMSRIRQQVSRFNALFRKTAGRKVGYVLKPQGNGTWLLQTPVFRTPEDADDPDKKYKHPTRNWDAKAR